MINDKNLRKSNLNLKKFYTTFSFKFIEQLNRLDVGVEYD